MFRIKNKTNDESGRSGECRTIFNLLACGMVLHGQQRAIRLHWVIHSSLHKIWELQFINLMSAHSNNSHHFHSHLRSLCMLVNRVCYVKIIFLLTFSACTKLTLERRKGVLLLFPGSGKVQSCSL